MTSLARFLTAALAALTLTAGCQASTHATHASTLGKVTSAQAMEALLDQPGPIDVETVVGADWAVTRAGLIDLDNPKAKAASLKDGDEPIQIFTHVIRHPTRGTFLIDTGVTRKLVDDPAGMGVGWVVRKYMHPEKMVVRTDTATLLRREPKLAGVLLTHLHLDHISGVPDVPADVPLYSGPGDASDRAFLFMFSQGTIDRMLAGHGAIQELPFAADPSGRFTGVLDLFGDGSLFAILVPGHTSGSIAYVARTPHGPVLFTGDTSHTRWGWEHDVPPGKFSADRDRNAVSLAALRGLATRHPNLDVRLGHQR
ncbi:MAG: MBL fold metallo-hydrolase [Polyangia bacterium]